MTTASKLTIFVGNNFLATADGKARTVVDTLIKNYRKYGFATLCTSSGIVIDALKVAILRKEINPEAVEIRFEGKILSIDAKAVISPLPDNFLRDWDNILDEILELRSKNEQSIGKE